MVQGGGKRPGAFAIYLEPWHADILDVLDLRKNHGKEEVKDSGREVKDEVLLSRGSQRYPKRRRGHDKVLRWWLE